jgi:hypothetical protein
MHGSITGPTGDRTQRRSHPANQALFKLQILEITRDTLLIRSSKEKTVIPLNEIQSYGLKWHLDQSTAVEKYWFLVLAVRRQNGQMESGAIITAKFNDADDESRLRRYIQNKVAEAMDLVLPLSIRNSNS